MTDTRTVEELRDAYEVSTIFKLMHFSSMQEVRNFIQDCEGRHRQQVAYSSFHDALTQVCFGCQKIRTNLGMPRHE